MGAHVINTMLGLFLVGLSWGLYVLLPVLIGYAVWQGFRQGIRPAITSVGMYTVATFVMPLLCLFLENTAETRRILGSDYFEGLSIASFTIAPALSGVAVVSGAIFFAAGWALGRRQRIRRD
jgi:Sec-independent protein secretion pathway component TatC